MTLIQTVMILNQTTDYLKKKSRMRRSRFFSEGSKSDNFVFIVDEEREDPNTIKKCVIIGPPAKRHLNCQQNVI